MKDVIAKIKILVGMVMGAFDEWREQVWKRDLDEQYCCDGRMCGCGGSTVGEVFGAYGEGR